MDLEERLRHVETELTAITAAVTNHLPTAIRGLDKKLEKLESRLWWFYTAAIGALVGLVVNLLLK